ncbi:unnamed protein product [Owenia fusiformis]|uniref:non-specific serine/threonine protein kinase n=1 Tax=Owenia fusiformis TaxID=6347 RepID=A0A8J1UUM8_OWEFU|nr:unnamed protein product [Owenia fusiformis]
MKNECSCAIELRKGNWFLKTIEIDFSVTVSNHYISIKIDKVVMWPFKDREWSGAIRLGVTTNDPSKLSTKELPRYACPELTNQKGNWARALSEHYAEAGNRITFYVDSNGQMHYFINNAHKGLFLNHIPTNNPLWLLFDVYGNTSFARFVPAEEAPVEILARGPDALHAYHTACESGTQPNFKTRLMIVGQDRVGKTSLKKALTGQKYNVLEERTDGIDLSSSCSFNLRDRSKWQIAINTPGDTESKETSPQDVLTEGNGTAEALEEEYHRAIATNIVQELLYKKKEREKEKQHLKAQGEVQHNTGRRESRSSHSGRTSATTKRKLEKKESISHNVPLHSDDIPSNELLKEMPEGVVTLVQQMWKERENNPRKNSASAPSSASSRNPSHNIKLNIWDFAGQAVYYTTHQVFLSSRAVYIIVFNLCNDLDELAKPRAKSENSQEIEWDVSELTNLDYIEHWVCSIHAHAAQNTRNSIDNTTLSPPIFIVGTHRNSLDPDPEIRKKLIDHKFRRIQEVFENKPHQCHIIGTCYSVENSLDTEDSQVLELRCHLEDIASKQPYMGEQIPNKWLRFEQAVAKLVEEGTYFVSLDQIGEVAQEEGITTDQELKTLLEFYHDLGQIIYYGNSCGALDNTLRNTVILKPQWLVNMFRKVITVKPMEHQWVEHLEACQKLEEFGVLESVLVDDIWSDVADQKAALLGLMEKFDLICERLPPKNANKDESQIHSKTYYVPSRLKKLDKSEPLYILGKQDVEFYLDFNGFLPDGLFHRMLCRAVRWSQESGGYEPKIYHRLARFFIDPEHDFVLEMQPMKFARMKVTILRVADLRDADEVSDNGGHFPPPEPAVCARVRNFLDSVLFELKEMWMRRISYKACIECTCDKKCTKHKRISCSDISCIHFLDLDECLANKIVCCDYKRIKTAPYRKLFPEPSPIVTEGPIIPDTVIKEADGNIEAKGPELPSWVKGAAKMLNGGSEGQDWTALAKKLGYKKFKIDKFNDDLNPGLMLLADWIITSGNTSLSIDMMVSYLEQMFRDDIVEIIQKGREAELEPPQVFISYQWDIQDEVTGLRDRLEKSGYNCWMDIGQMGGGDQLNAKIDEGIRNAKVVIACVSPKYIVSHHCNRELSLADLLHKAIIPVMFDRVPWPPPGGMSLVFSQLVYVDMKGIGGHGGSGIHADLESRYAEIIQRLSRYAIPSPRKSVEMTPQITQLNAKNSNHSQSTLSSGDRYSSNSEPLVIPDYAVGRDQRTNPTNRNMSHGSMGSRQTGVQQVHVQKCAVCTIL